MWQGHLPLVQSGLSLGPSFKMQSILSGSRFLHDVKNCVNPTLFLESIEGLQTGLMGELSVLVDSLWEMATVHANAAIIAERISLAMTCR